MGAVLSLGIAYATAAPSPAPMHQGKQDRFGLMGQDCGGAVITSIISGESCRGEPVAGSLGPPARSQDL